MRVPPRDRGPNSGGDGRGVSYRFRVSKSALYGRQWSAPPCVMLSGTLTAIRPLRSTAKTVGANGQAGRPWPELGRHRGIDFPTAVAPRTRNRTKTR